MASRAGQKDQACTDKRSLRCWTFICSCLMFISPCLMFIIPCLMICLSVPDNLSVHVW